MATASSIKSAIKKRVEGSKGSTYKDWTIGITTDFSGRKNDHGNPQHWTHWEADSIAVAREVETYFLNEFPAKASERMKGGTGGDIDPSKTVYVYIF